MPSDNMWVSDTQCVWGKTKGRVRPVKTRGIEMADLMNYATGESIRTATAAELAASIEAARYDGGAGVISVEINGKQVSCYVVE